MFIYTCHGSCASEHTLCQICHQSFRRRASLMPSDIISTKYAIIWNPGKNFFWKNHLAKILPWGHIGKPLPWDSQRACKHQTNIPRRKHTRSSLPHTCTRTQQMIACCKTVNFLEMCARAHGSCHMVLI